MQLASQMIVWDWPCRSPISRIRRIGETIAAGHKSRCALDTHPPGDFRPPVRCMVFLTSTTSTPRPRPRTGAGGARQMHAVTVSTVSSLPGLGAWRRPPTVTKQVQQLDRVIIRFAGDSGDGMQLAGDRFTQETATFGNDLSTLPNFPAEIRAPAGTLPGVSSFQLHFADHDILTPGDAPDVLVAMNPAALKANLGDLPRGADII